MTRVARRSVARCIGATLCVIALGIASREFPQVLPGWLGKYPGDALWALMVFCAWCALLPTAHTWQITAIALFSCAAVELSQLYHAPWLDEIRATTVGHLALGSVFGWRDLVSYVVGIVVGALIDAVATSRRSE